MFNYGFQDYLDRVLTQRVEPQYAVLLWLKDRWFTLHYGESRADAVAFWLTAEYAWGLPAVVRAV